MIEVVNSQNKTVAEKNVTDNTVYPHLEGLDLETVWQDYWGKYGDQLVWEGWVAKYPDQIDFEKLHAVPATAEVEVTSELISEETQNMGDSKEEVNDSADAKCITNCDNVFEGKAENLKEVLNVVGDRTPDMNGNKLDELNMDRVSSGDKEAEHENFGYSPASFTTNDNTVDEEHAEENKYKNNEEQPACGLRCVSERETQQMIVSEITSSAIQMDSKKCVLDGDIDDTYINPRSPLKYSSLSFKQISGSNIVNTLQNRVEGFGVESERNREVMFNQSDADNLANERTEMVQMLHSYSSFSSTETKDYLNTSSDPQNHGTVFQEREDLEDNNYDQMWNDLWNEHYTESYWYYYNQFADKFNQFSPKHAPVADEIGEVMFESEFIIIPRDSETCIIISESNKENIGTEDVDAQVNSQLTENVSGNLSRTMDSICFDKEDKTMHYVDDTSTNDLYSETNNDSTAISCRECSLEDCDAEDLKKNRSCTCSNATSENSRPVQCIDSNTEEGDNQHTERLLGSCEIKTHCEKCQLNYVVNESSMKEETAFISTIKNDEIDRVTEVTENKSNVTTNEDCKLKYHENIDHQEDRTVQGKVDTADDNAGPEPEDGSRKRRKKKERQERMQAQNSSSGTSGTGCS